MKESFRQLYRERLCTAQELASQIGDGWNLGMDLGVSNTPSIMEALSERAARGEVRNVTVQTQLESIPFPFYRDNSLFGKLTGMSWFLGAGSRAAVNGGWADFIPGYFRDIPGHIRRLYHYDAVCFSVSPMDEQGYFSFGAVNSYSQAMVEKADRVFVEVNACQPRALFGAKIHVSRVAAIVENNRPLPVLPPVVIDETSRIIGGLLAEQIPDGACIQLGIGAVPDAVGMELKHKHDLGIHTEMFTDSMVELIACGAVNNSKKQIHRGQSVTTFAFGSQRIYDYIDNNPDIAILPVEYVNDPAVICQNDNMISINAALEVDLWGQVCAESIGTRYISGTGGQVDYVRGACQSKGGKSFIAFASKWKNGESRIKSILTPGAAVSTSKNDVDYIVTEYGVAHLRGEPLSRRAGQLIAIAHPDFRDELRFEARKRGMLV